MRPGRDVATLTGCARALGTLPSTPAAAVAIPTLPRNLRRLWETFWESGDLAGEPVEDTPTSLTAWGVLFILRRSFVDPSIDRNFCRIALLGLTDRCRQPQGKQRSGLTQHAGGQRLPK